MISYEEINQLEARENYPAAIDALEHRLRMDANDTEAVIHLGFDYWLVIVENDRLSFNVPLRQYALRFMELLRKYLPGLGDNADFCFSYGLGLSMHYYYFSPSQDRTNLEEHEALGKELVEKAQQFNPMYKKVCDGKATQKELEQLFSKRMCFSKYYGVV